MASLELKLSVCALNCLAPELAIWRVPTMHPPTPPDIQTDLDPKQFDQLLNFWCLFHRKTTPPPPLQWRDFGLLPSLSITKMTIKSKKSLKIACIVLWQ
jgi:hypothetical protein